MKKFLFILAAFVSALSVQAENYGILVNGETLFRATYMGISSISQLPEYNAKVSMAANDQAVLVNLDNGDTWTVALDDASVKTITLSNGAYKASAAGCYDFWLKLSFGNDQLYIGTTTDCGEGEPYVPVEPCDEAYGLKVGDAIIVGQKNEQQTEWNEWMVQNVQLEAGQFVQLYDTCSKGTWITPLDLAGYQFATENGMWKVTEDGTYHFFIKLIMGADQVYVGKEGWNPPTYGVPGQCGDVLMQGFYWNSYMRNDSATATNIYGDNRWKTMLEQAGEIGAYFDLIWLPPSAAAGGTGYYPRHYSNQNSDWGTRADLEKLIASFHNSGTKVVADVVLDHFIAADGWCKFAEMDFGKYGKFTPDMTWITNGDEINTETDPDKIEEQGDCHGTATGPDDDGENNYGARDLAHQNQQVQAFSKAYLQWLLDEMHYDGFRWDEAKGFDPYHIGDYNGVANPYISFVERWSGTDDMKWTIERAGYRTMALDFQTKYDAFFDKDRGTGIANFNYSGCAGSGLLGAGYAKYAVTFIDNHDSFLRNDGEFGGYQQSMTPGFKDRLLQANAFLLAMPGVPCVFYPHWAKYKEEIKAMINARHLAGVHSESPVTEEEVSNSGYKATIEGKNGWLIIQLGDKTTHTPWDPNYHLVAYGPGYAMWVHHLNDVAPGIIVTPGNTAFEDSIAGINVTIQAVGGSGNAVIYYTTDGSTPTTESAVYVDTLNFTETTTLKVMAVCGTAQSKVQEYIYTYREPLKHGIRVRFDKPAEWNKAYIFAWKTFKDEKGNDASVNLMGAYPGKRMYQDVEGWFTYEFDLDMDTVHFCINSGNDCGDLNIRSNDLEADYDMCVEWLEGKETEERMEQVIEECAKELTPEFDMAIEPESGVFRDVTAGQEVIIRTIGDPEAAIYCTTNGTEPGPGDNMGIGEVRFTVNKSTMVKAYAETQSGKRTKTYSETYTYKEPQHGVITVKFQKPEDWEDLYLYAFTRVMKTSSQYVDTDYPLVAGESAAWPGMKWTEKDGNWYIHTMREVIPEGTDFYIIFNAGMDKSQSQDIFIAENTCYLWSDVCYRAVVDANCDGKKDEPEPWIEGIEVIENKVKNNNETYKLIINGHLVIVHNGAMYDVLGRKL